MVIPIFKKGSHTDPGNYRPIALLPNISKVLERIVHDKLASFLLTCLHDSQSGFKKGDGTVHQLLRLCQEWSRHVDNSAYVGILFFDLRKAFDRVWHNGLLSKLEAAGIRGSAFAWMKSFLRPAGSDPGVVCQKNSFLKVSVSLGGFGPSVAHGKHSVRRRCVQATKNKAETCSLR